VRRKAILLYTTGRKDTFKENGLSRLLEERKSLGLEKTPILLGDTDIFGGKDGVMLSFLTGQGADDLSWMSDSEAARREHRLGGHQGSRADHASLPDHRPIEDHRPHPDGAFLLDRAPVQDRTMANNYIPSHQAGILIPDMEDAVILDVTTLADLDPGDITT